MGRRHPPLPRLSQRLRTTSRTVDQCAFTMAQSVSRPVFNVQAA
ncbi:hypothetical protein J001_06198 [Cryptococcus neoformans]|nr:hypothetical protein J001_06198 [Cryptococcus neoformans var. grubii]